MPTASATIQVSTHITIRGELVADFPENGTARVSHMGQTVTGQRLDTMSNNSR